jgi:hypothetical protein
MALCCIYHSPGQDSIHTFAWLYCGGVQGEKRSLSSWMWLITNVLLTNGSSIKCQGNSVIVVILPIMLFISLLISKLFCMTGLQGGGGKPPFPPSRHVVNTAGGGGGVGPFTCTMYIRPATYSTEYRIQNMSETHVHKITSVSVFI